MTVAEAVVVDDDDVRGQDGQPSCDLGGVEVMDPLDVPLPTVLLRVSLSGDTSGCRRLVSMEPPDVDPEAVLLAVLGLRDAFDLTNGLCGQR